MRRLALALLLALGSACDKRDTAPPPCPDPGLVLPAAPRARTPIDHVFIIVKENHTFDNFFSTYPGSAGATHATDSHGSTRPLESPVTDLDYPGSNNWESAHASWDRGAMDRFDVGEESGFFWGTLGRVTHGPFVTYAPRDGKPGGAARYYWELARRGVLCDNYFTLVMGPSSPNHVFLVAASCGGLISNENLLDHKVKVMRDDGTIVDHPDHLTASEVPTTLPNELERKRLTWRYFQESEGGLLGSAIERVENNDASVLMLDVLTALPDFRKNFKEDAGLDSKLAGFLASGEVGHVTWIKPSPSHCEHPGLGHVSSGAEWTRAIVEQIGRSRYWSRCAVFITWDDYGGFYDHVAPPQVDRFGLGFRVPCLVVGPYVKKGHVDHTQYEHSSLLKFAEKVHGLPAMTHRDAASADMTAAFDFEQAPRGFEEFMPEGCIAPPQELAESLQEAGVPSRTPGFVGALSGQ